MGKSPVGRGQAKALGIWSLGWAMISDPARASRVSRDERHLAPGLWLYAAFLLASTVFFAAKPYNFPDPSVPPPQELQDFYYWFKVNLWHPPLDAAWIVLLLGLLRWFKDGRLGNRMLAAAAWAALPGLLILLYYNLKVFPRLALALGTAAWLYPLRPLLRGMPREEWFPMALFMVALNALGLVILIPMSVCLAGRWREAFMAAQIGGGLWMLRNGALGIRELSGLRLSRAFLAVLFSLFHLVGLSFLLHFLGAPAAVLKAVFYG